MGCTSESCPKCSAIAWSRNEKIIRANPPSQTARRNAWVRRPRVSVESAGASSTPMRWKMLVSALAIAAPRAQMKTMFLSSA